MWVIWWVLNGIIGVPVRVVQSEIETHRRGEGNVTPEAEIRVMWPQAEECWQPLGAGRDEE